MASAPASSIVIVTITDYSTVYPTATPPIAFPTYAPYIPPSAVPSTTLTTSPIGTAGPAPSATAPAHPHDAFNIKSLTPMFIAISCIALLLVLLFAYAVWSKCCIGGRFGFGFRCRECKDLKEELEQWKSGEKKLITRDMVRARESFNSGIGVPGVTVTSVGASSAHPPVISAYYADDKNSNNDYNAYNRSRTGSHTNFADIDLEANILARDSAREDTLAGLQDRPSLQHRRTSTSTSSTSSPFWAMLKARFGPSSKGKSHTPDIELNTASIYSQSTYHPHPRSFTEHSSPSIPFHPPPRTRRTSIDAPQKTYSAYLAQDYAPRDKERKILLAESGLNSHAYKEAEAAIARGSVATADLQHQLDVVNRVDRDVQRARHPSMCSPSGEQLPSPTEFEGY